VKGLAPEVATCLSWDLYGLWCCIVS